MADTDSSFPPPPPTPQQPDPNSFYTDPDAAYGPPPMSGLAVTGFVMSILFCVPGVCLLGTLLSFIGIFVARPGKRRGRGLAIAGVVIGVLVCCGQGALGVLGYKVWIVMMQDMKEVKVPLEKSLTASTEDIGNFSGELYKLTTSDFQTSVSEQQLNAWLENRVKALGQMQSMSFSGMDKNHRRQVVFSFDGNFVNGPATVQICLYPVEGEFNFRLDDLSIDGVSVRDFKQVDTP